MSILASTSSASTAAGWGGMIIWLVVLFGFMYFFMIRPQQKEAKKKNAMLSELSVGDTVLTTSGFYGTVIDNTTMQSLPYLISSSAPLKLFCQAAEYKFHKYSTPIKKNLLCFLIHT